MNTSRPRRVLILQPYVPDYRVPLFALLTERAPAYDLTIRVAAALSAPGVQNLRGDASKEGFISLRGFEIKILGARLTVRHVWPLIRQADVVVLEQARRNLDLYAIVLLRRLRRKPILIMWGHGKTYVRKEGVIREQLRLFLTRQADWFLAYTAGGAKAVVDAGIPARRVTELRNSTDTRALRAEISRLSRRGDGVPTALSDLKGRKVALALGGLDASKRIRFLVDAARLVHQWMPDFTLVVAGDGTDRDIVAKCDGLNDYIYYFGRVTGVLKAELLDACSLIVNPGRVGLVVADSFAAGKPIVTTNWPLHAPEYEYLIDGVTAVVAENDEESFARSIYELLEEPSRLSVMQRACWAAGSELTIEKMADSFLDGISRAVDTTRIRSRAH